MDNLILVAGAICADLNHELVQRVGAGAFKETYLVRSDIGQELALKVLDARNSLDRVEREIEAMRRCNHRYIAKLFQIGGHVHGGQSYLYFLEEFLPGPSLAQRLSSGPLSRAEVLVLGDALIQGLGHIASQGLVHRDLKPDNIMYRVAGGDPVIVDFGLVRTLGDLSLTKTWLATGPGTPLYSAPEQLQNDKDLIDWRTDQFALGLLLAESAFGYHPFLETGENLGDAIAKVASRGATSSRFTEDSRKLALPVLTRMLSTWPVRRFRSPEELLDAWRKQESLRT